VQRGFPERVETEDESDLEEDIPSQLNTSSLLYLEVYISLNILVIVDLNDQCVLHDFTYLLLDQILRFEESHLILPCYGNHRQTWESYLDCCAA
jgi:hypothetical protein